MREMCRELICLACFLSVLPAARADLRFQESQANAGAVATGGKLFHHFRFVNEGPEKIVISNVRRSCGCLEPILVQREYGPGEEGTLALEVNTVTQGPGVHIWTLDIHYLDGASPRHQRLELTAKMIPQISVEPAMLIVHPER